MNGFVVLLALAVAAVAVRAAEARRRRHVLDARHAASADALTRYRRELLHFAGQLRWDDPDDDRLRRAHRWLRDHCPDKDLDRSHLAVMNDICAELVAASSHRLEPKYVDLAVGVASAKRSCAALSPEQRRTGNRPGPPSGKRSERGNYDEA